MYSKKTLIAAAALAVLSAAGSASAAPWEHRDPDRPGFDHRPGAMMHRHYVERTRIADTLRTSIATVWRDRRSVFRARSLCGAQPQPLRPHRVFVEVDPYSGAFIGEFRI